MCFYIAFIDSDIVTVPDFYFFEFFFIDSHIITITTSLSFIFQESTKLKNEIIQMESAVSERLGYLQRFKVSQCAGRQLEVSSC